MEARALALIEYIEKQQLEQIAKSKAATTDYLTGFYAGHGLAFKLCAIWLRRDVLKQKVTNAKAEVEPTSP